MFVDFPNRYSASISQIIIHRPLVVHGVLPGGLVTNFRSKALLLFKHLYHNTDKYLGVLLICFYCCWGFFVLLGFFLMKCLPVANSDFKSMQEMISEPGRRKMLPQYRKSK